MADLLGAFLATGSVQHLGRASSAFTLWGHEKPGKPEILRMPTVLVTDLDLSLVVESWDRLPDANRSDIVGMVRVAAQGTDRYPLPPLGPFFLLLTLLPFKAKGVILLSRPSTAICPTPSSRRRSF